MNKLQPYLSAYITSEDYSPAYSTELLLLHIMNIKNAYYAEAYLHSLVFMNSLKEGNPHIPFVIRLYLMKTFRTALRSLIRQSIIKRADDGEGYTKYKRVK